jgi:hypothetical protein
VGIYLLGTVTGGIALPRQSIEGAKRRTAMTSADRLP